jgi:hypothetical protein
VRGTKADTTEESAHKATPTAQRHTLPRPDKREALKAAEKLTIALGEAEVVVTSFFEIRQPKA